MGSVDGVVVVCSEFGPLDLLSDWAHEFYLDGFSERAVQAAREAIPVARGAGDLRTLRFLHYTCGVALIEQRRWDDAIVAAHDLLSVVEPWDSAWRAKALSLLGDAGLRLGRASAAVDALAEAFSLVEHDPPKVYNQLSATMAVAATLSHAQLFTPADDLFRLCLSSPAVRGPLAATRIAKVLVLQEYSVLHATWGTALLLDGRDGQAYQHFVRSAEVALQMMQMTAGSDDEMHARAELVEGYAQLQLGETELAEVRLMQAAARFEMRPELPEVQISCLGRALCLLERGRYDPARDVLREVLDSVRVADRVVWELATLATMAEVEVAEHGEHPSTQYYAQSTQVAAQRLWIERESRFFAMRDRISLRALAAEASQLGRDAMIDPLTGLGNRRMLDVGIAQSLGGAALFVDIDLFKVVNDRFSHSVGDEVLRRIADILRAHCRSHDVVVRFGGDEFVVLLPATAAVEAAAVGERVRAAVYREHWEDLRPGLAVSVSVGVAASEASTDRVLKDADAALYAAKESGRNRVAVY
ncbi:diguanylate cyclase [Angustibacter sp. McL0619]|uniref:diguanylate cyclase n=1 Tax=Angustibacter sp. McL0619 TaxID=3415676 RepID=UPI003CE6E790